MTAIEWTDVTWNPTRGCSRVSEGCRHCYAEVQAARIVRMGKGKPTAYDGLVKLTAAGEPRWSGKVIFDADKLAAPLGWKKPRRVFVNSMSDLFHESLTNDQIAAVFGVMAACPQHTFQVLTKRAKRMRQWFEWLEASADNDRYTPAVFCFVMATQRGIGQQPRALRDSIDHVKWPLPNAWLGVSVENQAAADERIPDLLATPAALRFLSCEPLLGPIDLSRYLTGHNPYADIDWVIAGCESGPGARPAEVDWYRSLRDQCAAAGVPFFLKQAKYVDGPRGTRSPISTTAPFADLTKDHGSKRKPGGVIGLPYLDGVQHVAMPERKT